MIKTLLKSKRGITLTELVVALSLLMIIVVGTTPALMSSYEGLYTAGQYTQDTYEAKSEIENTLATRNTRNTYPGFVVNFQNFGEVAELNGKRAVSSLEASLESLFAGAKVHIAVISSKYVNDDFAGTGYHDVVIQTTNIDFGTTNEYEAQAKLAVNTPTDIKAGSTAKLLDLTFILPNKMAAGEAEVYSWGNTNSRYASVDYDHIKVDPLTGRIAIRINGFDFTQSPIKILATYIDENKKVQSTFTYLHIKTPTIIAAGETSTYDYYTSPGVVELSAVNQGSANNTSALSFNFFGRDMRTDNATGTQAIPAGTIFKSVNWITETTRNGDFVGGTSYEPSYYVLTGTNGAIYRTYTFTGENAVRGKVNISTTDPQTNGTNQSGADVIGVSDKPIILADRTGSIIYPAVWGGDFSHIYGYSAYHLYGNYLGEDTWYTQSAKNSGVGQPGYYSNTARFGYFYNGYGFNYNYNTQNSKKISYILTELENGLRVGGFMDNPGDYDAGVNRIWERPLNLDGSGQGEESQSYSNSGKGYWYKKAGENLLRCVNISINKSGENFRDKHLNQLPVYFANNGSGDEGRWSDVTFAQLRIKGLTTISPNFLYEQKDNDDDKISSFKFVFNNTTNKSKVTVTDAVYIPSTDPTAPGEMFYVGSVAAYGIVNQNDNASGSANYAAKFLNNGSVKGYPTTYYIMGNDDSTATSIYKYSATAQERQSGNEQISQNKAQITGTGVKANSDESREFFVTRNSGANSQQLFSDLLFTMGFASNREMVYSKIVYGKDESGTLQQSYKYYESFYFKSRYGDTLGTHVPTLYMNGTAATQNSNRNSNGYSNNITDDYLNKPNNDYYNVWFPGEMYNLTKTATKEGVTVSAGYAVSGSTYTWINPNQSSNTSTALGGLYNDGVISGMVLGSDTSYSSLLYFKDTENFDNVHLGDGTVSYYSGDKTYRHLLAGGDQNFNYGTHQRDSVQFTAIDIGIQYKSEGAGEKADYYAYYADNKGRVFRSKIATRTTSGSTKGTPQMVSYVSDIIYQQGDTAMPKSDTIGYMEQLDCHPDADKNFQTIFDEITSIKIDGSLVFVTGKPNQANAATINTKGVPVVVGEVDDSTGAITWFTAYIRTDTSAAYHTPQDLVVLSGYLYLAGTCENQSVANKGFIAAVNTANIRNDIRALKADSTKPREKVYTKLYTAVPDRLYAIDGHMSE